MTTEEELKAKRAANAAYMRAYRAKNREKMRLYHEARRRAAGMKPMRRVTDPSLPKEERRRQLDRLRYIRDKDKRLAASREYQQKNREVLAKKKAARFKATYRERKAHLLEQHRKDRIKHRAKRAATQRRWQRANRDKTRQYEKRYLEKNPHVRTLKNNRRRARLLAASTDKHAEAFVKRIRSMKRVPCYYCGKIIRGRDAHIDHVHALSKSLNHESFNLCASCSFCNCSKCDRSLADWTPPTNQQLLTL
jgi:hypothetical protein